MNNQQTIKRSGSLFVLTMAAMLLLSGCVPAATSLMASWFTIARVETSGQTEPVESVLPAASAATAEGVAGEVTFCPELARPAMFLFLPGDDYVLFDPTNGEICPLPLAEPLPGLVAMAQDDVFLASRTSGPEGEATVIQRYRPDGTVEALPYTLVDTQAGAALVAFTISDDAGLIAWSVLGPTGGSDLPSTSLSIADLETGEVLAGVALDIGEAPRALKPIRFSEDGSRLYYTLHPYGIGGMWSSYVGRYDNLYAISTDGAGMPEPIFDCADRGLGLCLGDFFLVDSTVTGLAYVDRNAGTVVVQNGEGDVLNTLKAEETYIGYPTWGPSGELVYYTADLSDDPAASATPEMGLLHRVAPATAPAETVVSDSALLLPVRFLNDTQVVVNWAGENGNWGLALVGVDGSVQVLDLPAGAILLDLPADSTLLGVSGGTPPIPAAIGDATAGVQATCPEPTVDQAWVGNEAAGSCFTIPAGYKNKKAIVHRCVPEQ